MNKEKSYLVVAVLVALAVIALYYWGGSPTGFAIFSEASDLNSGTFSDTLYNGTAILLNGSSGLLTGNYTSPVFGNGSSVLWNNISWQGGVPTDSTLLFKVTDCSSSNCSDAAFADATSLNNLVSLTGLNEPYFQYITLFSIKKLDVDSASLTSAVVGYTLLDPAIVINSPVAQGYSSGEVNVNVSFDESFDLSESWYSLDAGLTNITLIGGNATLNLGEGNHNLIVYANDTSGILELKEVSFSIDILSCSDKIYGLCADTASCTAAGGYWYDDTCNGTAPPAVANSSTESAASAEATTSSSSEEDNSVVTVPVPKPTSPIVFETINDTTLGSGDLQELYLKINNSGKGFLFACNPTAVGNYSSWISYEGGSKNINPGEEVVFDLSVNVPSDVEEGSYSIPLSVGCSDGVSASTDYNIIIKEEKLELDIVSVQRAGSDHVRVSYILKELAGEDQEVNVSFSLLDLNNSEIAGATELKSIVAESSQEFNMDIPFGGDLGSDELNLKANLNSEIYSSSVLEPVTLGGSIGGFAIFDFRNIGRGRAVLFLAVLFALIILFIVLRKIRKSREKKDPKK